MGKVIIVSAVFPPEPVVSAKLSYDIANRLNRCGEKVIVLTPRPSRPLNFAFPKENEIFPFEHLILSSFVFPQSKLMGRFKESISFGKATSKYIQQHSDDIDAIYANTWPLFAQYYLARTAKRYGIPFYIHVQDIYPESYCHKLPTILGRIMYRSLLPIDRYVLRNAKRVFAISPAMKSYLSVSRRIDSNRIVLVRNWQDDREFIDSYTPIEYKSDPTSVMYVGSINPTANVPLIIKAFTYLDKSLFHLSIIGNGPDKEFCHSYAVQSGVEASFDTIEPEMVAKKQSEADILVLCLRKGVAKTATPSKLTAYMFSGRPIIASVDLDSDCANIIRESGCGIVVEPENDVALSAAIQNMATKGIDERNRYGRSGIKYAEKYLSKDNNLKIVVDALINDRERR